MSKTKSFHTEDIPDLSGQVIIVTGGNAGLGYETIRQLAEHNPSRIYLAARSQDKAEAAIKSLTESNPSAPISFLPLDLSSFASIKAAVEQFKQLETRLDVLMNNAGVMMTPEGLTKEGYEIQFGTNVVGPTLLTILLLPLLQRTAKINPQARVVNLSSASEVLAPKDIYPIKELKTTMSTRPTTQRYTISKIANIHLSAALAKKYKDVKIISVHPGMVSTALHHNSTGFFLRPFLYISVALFATPVEKGALSQIWAAVSPDAKSGEYYSPVGIPGKGSKQSRNRQLQEQLWNFLEQELEGHY
jgi:NAD(P)-dependent dehydrogenase (short-subunit alcohol dehydrogenase family)